MTTPSGKRITQNTKIKRALASEGYHAETLVAMIEREAVDAYHAQLAREGRAVVRVKTQEERHR